MSKKAGLNGSVGKWWLRFDAVGLCDEWPSGLA